jgi:hypothetical protein
MTEEEREAVILQVRRRLSVVVAERENGSAAG